VSRGRVIAAALLAAALFASACARPAGEQFRPLTAPDPDAAYRELLRIRGSFSGIQSYARMRASSGERRQSFNARIAIDRSGRARIDGLTPLGTAAITIWSDGQNVVYLDHVNSIVWTGRASALSGALRVVAERGALLVAGLPADDPAVRHRAVATGLAEAEVAGVRFTYDPPQFPPQRVVVESGTDRLEIEHAEFRSGTSDVTAPRIDASYRRGGPPSLVPSSGG
jgi:hypothetical protein